MCLIMISNIIVSRLYLLQKWQELLINDWKLVKDVFKRKDMGNNSDKLILLCGFSHVEYIEGIILYIV
jgi:hypothetical protein